MQRHRSFDAQRSLDLVNLLRKPISLQTSTNGRHICVWDLSGKPYNDNSIRHVLSRPRPTA